MTNFAKVKVTASMADFLENEKIWSGKFVIRMNRWHLILAELA